MTAYKCACGIDIHAHVVPENFPAYLGSKVPAQWPSMAPSRACHRNVMISGKVYREVSDKCWDVSKRIADMPAMGLALQAISPMPELLGYWLEAADAAVLLRYINEQIAEMIALAGTGLIGLGAVPLQDVDLAIQELHYCVEKLGFKGVEIGSNINGVVIGDARFDPFFEACESLGAAVFVHALRPVGMDRLIGPPNLQQVLAYPSDVGLAAASLLTTNMMVRRPKLRIAFSHGGGTLASLLPRLEQSVKTFPKMRELMTVPPSVQARQLFFDTLVFDTPMLEHIVSTFGESQVMIGTDYPFAFHDSTPVERIAEAAFDDALAKALIYGNAQRFLGLPSGEPTPLPLSPSSPA
jgi:aminocarboxymuconate-semialdehyde decarboxylase